MLPENIQRNFVKKDVNHRTRSKQQLVRSCVSSNVRSMSLCVYGITLWNYSYRTLSNITKTATHPTTQLIRTDEHTTTGKFKQLVGKTEKVSFSSGSESRDIMRRANLLRRML